MKTPQRISIPLALFAAAANAHPTSIPGCEGANTTTDVAACRSKQIDSANLKLEKYLAAARVRASTFDLNPASINEEQRAWEAYRTRHCGNVYDVWRDGTIRYEMSALCTLEVTRERTADVWRAYLTYMDSTPPVLPDPSQQ